MDFISLLTVPAAAVAKKLTRSESALPSYKPRWWYNPIRLDARPVAWSLRNRPEDWEWRTTGITLMHKPSRHEFWIAIGGPHLYDANCSCTRTTRGRFQRFQGQFVFKPALRKWKKLHAAAHPIDQQFAEHFVYERKTDVDQ